MRHPLLAAAHWPLGSPEPPEIVPRGSRVSIESFSQLRVLPEVREFIRDTKPRTNTCVWLK